ncbi:MAG: hypothetical protein QOD99_1263 [Chthoniobacter sp.]|jgi:chromosome segregation ATPase|nr:hypothetical protein [Chthoniobacter sp.]
MRDVRFTCSHCQQPLVVDEEGAGLTVHCPQCSKELQIPSPISGAVLLSKAAPSGTKRLLDLERKIYDAETQLNDARGEAEQRQRALVETLQELRSAKQECGLAQDELGVARDEREMLEAQLARAQTAALYAQEQLAQVEAERQRLALHADQIESELSHRQKQNDSVLTERNTLRAESAQKTSALNEFVAQLETMRHERMEIESIAHSTQLALGCAEEERTELRARLEQLTVEAAKHVAMLGELEKTLAETRRERDQFAADVRQNHELADFLALKSSRDLLEEELRTTQGSLSDTREKHLLATGERDTLRREAVDLRLKLSALRVETSECDLRRDNEVLRGIIERLNEELKDRPAPRKSRRNRDQRRSRVSDLARAVWARCFISDPEGT